MLVSIILSVALIQTNPSSRSLEDYSDEELLEVIGIEVGDWKYQGTSSDGNHLFFTMAAPVPSMLWTRYENFEGDVSKTSGRELVEARCQTGQLRTVQKETFSAPNLQGQPRREALSNSWSYPPPGTFSEVYFKLICRL